MGNRIRLIDIGANLVDEMYEGIYNGSKKHESDLGHVLQRAYTIGLQKIFVTAGNLEEADKASKLVSRIDPTLNHDGSYKLYNTIGVHPTRCSEFVSKFESPQIYIERLKTLYDTTKDRIVALGEFGLDFDRTNFCDIETQKKFFELQLAELCPYTKLPLFLHCRGTGAAKALADILTVNESFLKHGGVVHSFDGSLEEMNSFVSLGLHIGINGCSLKTQENCSVVEQIPVNRLLLETDSPWCGIRPSHASFKLIKTKFQDSKKWTETAMLKQRNEPQTLLNILEVVAALKGIDAAELCETVYENTMSLFFPKEVSAKHES